MSRTAQRTVPIDLLTHLRRARDYVDRHYPIPLSLDDMANVAGVSKYHFALLRDG